LLIIFAVIVYGHVFSNGLCCADDSTFATVAKNLAFGKGYVESTPLDGSIGVKPFDPAVGTGPTVIIPAAALVYVLGNVPWAPGFATATISFSLLLFLAFDESHDFAFSFIVFQHIPSTDVIASYCREVCRVLRPGSLFKFQVNGVVWERHDSPDTWVGVSFAEADVRRLCGRSGFQWEMSQGAGTQYFWLWWRKPLNSSGS